MAPRDFFFKLLGVGWFVGICIVGGAALGRLIDYALDTFPLFSMLLLTLGTVFSLYMVYRWLSPGVKKSDKRNDDDKRQD